jgi:UDP-arabinose 4-epimerase
LHFFEAMLSTTILVTGGAGYIGSHTCKALAKAGFAPVVYDSLVRGHEWAVRWGPLEKGDINDRARLADVFRRHRPAAVLHFAGLIAVGESVQEPLLYHRANIGGTLTLLEAMREVDDSGKLVFSSTAAVYGIPDTVPIPETATLRPINPYGHGKLMAERLIADAATHGVAWVALRYFNATGADPEGEIGEAHDPETHLVPRALMAAAGALPEFQIFGEDYDTPDGTCIRDYIHVTDLAEAHVAAVRHLLAGRSSQAINVGTGKGYSVREVVDTVKRVTGRDFACPVGQRRDGDPSRLVADGRRAVELLGFQPRHSSLSDIVTHAWAWLNRPRS